MKYLTGILLVMAVVATAAACDPPQAGRPMSQSYAAPPGFMLVPIQRPQQQWQQAPSAMAYAAPRAMYAPAMYAKPTYSSMSVSVSHQRAILPRNRNTTVTMSGVGYGGGMMMMSARVGGGGRAAACAT